MPRIAFYAPMKSLAHPVPSGDRQVARLLFRALERAGMAPFEASDLRSYDAEGDAALQARIAKEGLKQAKLLMASWRQEPAVQWPTAWFTYHVYHKAPDPIGPVVAEMMGIPYLVAEASHAEKRRGGPWHAGLESAERAIRQATRIFCLNPNDRGGLADLLGSEDRMVDLPPFLDAVDLMRQLPDRDEARGEAAHSHGLDPDQPILLTVAMMRPGDKTASYMLLADALDRLADRPWQLLVVGDGAARAEIERRYRGLSARVRFLGELDQRAMLCAARASDIFVWPAINEAFGMAMLEAQAAGLPVVAGRAGGVDRVIADQETGLIVDDVTPDRFAAAIAELLDDDGLRRSLAAGTRPRVLDSHDIDSAARTLRRQILPLVRTESPPPPGDLPLAECA